MNQSLYERNSNKLKTLMEQVGCKNLEELGKKAKISQLQLARLQYGLIHRMSVENLLKLSIALNLSPDKLIDTFLRPSRYPDNWHPTTEIIQTSGVELQEYQRLQQAMEQQKTILEQEYHAASIQTIESWLLQWPTAVAAITKNPEISAERLLPLVKPIEDLVSQWGIETIFCVGQQLPYDPQWHELMKGEANPGDLVMVRYVGYKQGDKLLYKAKVSPLE